MRRSTLVITLTLAAAVAGVSLAQPAFINAALTDPGRPASDVARDALRKPGEVLAFSRVKPGETVIELLPGGRLLHPPL